GAEVAPHGGESQVAHRRPSLVVRVTAASFVPRAVAPVGLPGSSLVCSLGSAAGESAVLGQYVPELPARGNAELGEHGAQVPFDRARADEQMGADLRVGQAVAGEPGDLLLLRRELAARLGTALAYLFTRRQQLAAGALGERLHPDRGEHVMGRTQLFARVGTPALATQP